jgi:hypothetical protein
MIVLRVALAAFPADTSRVLRCLGIVEDYACWDQFLTGTTAARAPVLNTAFNMEVSA